MLIEQAEENAKNLQMKTEYFVKKMHNKANLLLTSGHDDDVFFADQINQIVKMQDIRMDNFTDTYNLKHLSGTKLEVKKKMMSIEQKSFKSIASLDEKL